MTALENDLVSVQMYDIHLKANQCFHQGNGHIGVQVISSAFKHRMSKRKGIQIMYFSTH